MDVINAHAARGFVLAVCRWDAHRFSPSYVRETIEGEVRRCDAATLRFLESELAVVRDRIAIALAEIRKAPAWPGARSNVTPGKNVVALDPSRRRGRRARTDRPHITIGGA